MFGMITTFITGAKTYIILGCLAGLIALGGYGGYKLSNVKYYKLQEQIAQKNLDAANKKLAKFSEVLNRDVVKAEIDSKDLERIKKAMDKDAKVTKPTSQCFTPDESKRLRSWPKSKLGIN